MWDEVRVFGDDGMIELRRPLSVPLGWRLAWFSDRFSRMEEIEADATPGGCTRDFVDAILDERPPVCSFAEAVTSVRLMEAAFLSANQDETWIEFAPPREKTTAAA